jgi:predicted RNA-binding protein YlxR (DUF448 family)
MTTGQVPSDPLSPKGAAAEQVEARPYRTKAQADRERRCIVSGEVVPEAGLIRFVAGSDGAVVADLARKLPGRGLWVMASREAVSLAAKKGSFSRAAKARLSAPADLADQVEALLRRRILDGLGLARRAGDLTFGFEKAGAAITAGKVAWMIEASDGAEDGRRKILQIARRAARMPRLLGIFSGEELSLALGLGNVIHLVFLSGRGANRWTEDVERLSGFRPLCPPDWRAEP